MTTQISITDSAELIGYVVGLTIGTLIFGLGIDVAGIADLGIAERLGSLFGR